MGTGVMVAKWIERQCRGGVVVALAALWLVAAGWGGRAAWGQAVKGNIMSVGIGGMPGQNGVFREGCWVPVQVHLQNLTGQPIVGHLGVDQDLVDLDGDKVLCVGPEFTLAAGVEGRTLWAYYWPRPDYSVYEHGISKVVVLDKNGAVVPNGTLSFENGMPQADHVSVGGEFSSDRSSRFVVVLGSNAAGWNSFVDLRGGPEPVRKMQVGSAQQLPDNVLGFDGVDVLVWEADRVKVSDVPAEFQLQAILNWVKAGGHLIISVGSQGQEFMKGGTELMAALPMSITGTRTVKTADLSRFATGRLARWGGSLSADLPNAPETSLVQAIGELKAGTKVVAAEWGGQAVFGEHPLAVTGQYGQGAVTLVTIDVSNPELLRMSEPEWITFWTQMAGWRQNQLTSFYTPKDFDKLSNELKSLVDSTPSMIKLGKDIEQKVDVSEETAVRILIALLFLAVYWMLAGPVGFLALRQYKLTHWSWWVFGGTVILAIIVAGGVVLLMHVKAYEMRHRTFVMGTVNSPEATVAGFYGIYAPVSGPVTIAQPATPGLNYLTPMCMPTTSDVKAFADPQSYQLRTEQAGQVAPVFRNTLKKLQGRWSGELREDTGAKAPRGIMGAAEYVPNATDLRHMINGKLKNNSGYDLRDADLLVYLPPASAGAESRAAQYGATYLFHMTAEGRAWKQGEEIDLATQPTLDLLEMQPGDAGPGTVEMALEAYGWRLSGQGQIGRGYGYPYPAKSVNVMQKSDQMQALQKKETWREDFLDFLADARNIDEMLVTDRTELERGIGRLTDCTKVLHAAGGLILAHAEDVKSPVPLQVNGRVVDGKGAVAFAWALPLGGTAPQAVSVSGAPAGPARGGRRGTQSILPAE